VFGEVPVLPVVLPLGMALFVVFVGMLRVRHRLSLPRAAVAACFAVYFGGIVANTVFPIYLSWPRTDGPRPLPVDLVPIAGYELVDALTNMLVFLPLGVLVPLVLARPSWGRVLAGVALTSLAIEMTQFVTALWVGGGHIADVNDWLFNTVGGLLGFGLLCSFARIPFLGRFVDHFRWVRPDDGDPSGVPLAPAESAPRPASQIGRGRWTSK